MIKSEVSGVVFSRHPTENNTNQIIIEAGFGLGEAVVTGRISPDRYILTKTPLKIAKKTISKQEKIFEIISNGNRAWSALPQDMAGRQKLSDKDIMTLANLVIKIESHYGFPVDVEWAKGGDTLHILQSRPITTKPIEAEQGKYVWSNVNIAEVLPGVNPPLVTSLLIAGLNPVFQKILRLTKEVPIAKNIKGRLYFNISAIEKALQRLLKIQNLSLVKFFGGAGYEKEVFLRISFWAKVRLSIIVIIAFISSLVSIYFLRKKFAFLDKKKELIQNRIKKADSLPDLIKIQKEFSTYLFSMMASLFNGILPSVSFYFIFVDLCNKWLKHNGNELLSSGGGELDQVQAFNSLWMLSREIKNEENLAPDFMQSETVSQAEDIIGRSQFIYNNYKEFLEKHGHRRIQEFNFFLPRWSEDPSFIIMLLKKYIETPEEDNPLVKQRGREESHRNVLREVLKEVPWWKRVILRWLYSRTKKGLYEREHFKSEILKLFLPLRFLCLKIGSKLYEEKTLADPTDIFFLTKEEFDALSEKKILRTFIEERKEAYKKYKNVTLPDIIDETGGIMQDVPEVESRVILYGIAASAGKVEGTARVINSMEEIGTLNPGDILVTDHTDPGWIPVFVFIKGVITNRGGLLSHAVIVAREYGLPAVVNVPNATTIIKDTRRVILDGDKGIVKIIN